MPEPRPVQTYSTLLEDRRIIEAAAEANEPSSLVVHLLEKEWTISTGKVAHPGPGARRFSYSQPISSLLDDIQARRIPSEFTDIFRKLDVKFFEGCLLVEMHDSRPPAKGGPPKPVEPSIAKYVLRPTAESLWADIRNAVDTQKNWGDKEALELEARLVLSTAPPLCLDPSPTVNRIANVVMRSSAYGKTSFKRKQNEDADDDGEIIKRRKLMQLMNPRVGKPFTPTYRALMHKQAPSQKPSAIRPPPAPSVAPAAPPQNLPRPSNGPTAPPAVANNPAVSHQLPQASLQSQQQAQMPARHRSASIKVPPDARQAAAAAARSRVLQNQVANTQQQQQATGAMRAAAAAAGAQVPGGPMPMANGAQNQHNVNAAAQLTAIQNARAPFPLTLPGTKHPSTAMGGASPPKPTTLPPGAQGAVPNLPQNGQPVPSDATAVQQTPRLQNATPSNTGPPNPANQTGMQAYHQNLVNEAQNSMLQMNVAQQAYNAATANVPGVVRPQYNINYAMAMARQAQLGAGMPGANAMNPQQQLVAYQQQMGMVGQPMHPRMQIQIQQAGYGGVQMMQQPPAQTQQQQNQRAQQYMQALYGQANQLLSTMTPDDMQKLVETKTTDQLRNNPQWIASDITGKARAILIGILRTQYANRLAQATAQQVSQAAN